MPMDDRRTTEGVEHLQAAARELLGAARAFLDVVEEVVEDPERVSSAAHGVSDLLRTGLGLGRRAQPWERAAWAGDAGDADAPEPSQGADTSWWDEPFDDDEPAVEAPAEKAPAEKLAAKKPAAKKRAPAKKAAAKKKAPAAKAPATKAPATKTADAGAPSAEGTPDATPSAAASGRPSERPSRVRRIAVD